MIVEMYSYFKAFDWTENLFFFVFSCQNIALPVVGHHLDCSVAGILKLMTVFYHVVHMNRMTNVTEGNWSTATLN